MSTGIAAIDNLLACFDSVDELLGGLDDGQWATQSYCPDWDTRGVAMHLAAVEAMLTGEAPGSFTDSVPFGKVGQWVSAASDLDNAALLAHYRETIATRRAELTSYTADQMQQPSMTPVGPQTYGRFMAVRVFDYWVHEQDVRGPLGLPGHQSGPAAEMALDEIRRSLGFIVGKKIGLPDGKSITFALTGPVETEMHAVVDGRAAPVDALDGPADVVVAANSTVFALLACGRIDPQGAIDEGTISWTGDAEWGESAARNLAFTM